MASLAAAYAAAAAKKHAYAKPAFAPAKRSNPGIDANSALAKLSGYDETTLASPEALARDAEVRKRLGIKTDKPKPVIVTPLLLEAIDFDAARHARALDKGLDDPIVNQARPNFKTTRPGQPRIVKQRFGQETQTHLTNFYVNQDLREPKFSGQGAEISRLIVAPYEQLAIALTQWGNALRREQRARREAMLNMKAYNERAEASRQVMKALMADFNS